MPIKFEMSERFSLSREDVQSILRGAAIAAGGAFATYVLEWVAKQDFGEIWTPAVVAVLSVAINALRKWVGQSNYAIKK